MIKKFNEFINDILEEGYLRRIISSEINKEERIEDKIKRETIEKNNKIEKIKSWLDNMKVKYYVIDDISLEIDVDADVHLEGRELKGRVIPKIKGGKLPDYIKFRKINGSFYCMNNNLTSLEGFPSIVDWEFNCSNNKLISLKDCPKEVHNRFDCSRNELISLEHCPEKVGWRFDCSNNQLTSLEYCPDEIHGDFDCSHNKLTSLEYCPKKVGRSFDCSNNELTSLKYCPDEIHSDFDCSHNKLTSLEYCPKKVGEDFDCSYNKLITLEHCPKEVGWNFKCSCCDLKSFRTGYDKKVEIACFICYCKDKNKINIEKEDIIEHFYTKDIYFKNENE